MIKRIFFDNDECLSHSMYDNPEQESITLVFECGEFYYTVIRPSAIKLLEFARNLVGAENVYMLTSATREHAEQINEKGGFGFPLSNIHAREDMKKYEFRGAYGSYNCYQNPEIADESNVLIDNLRSRDNSLKMQYIGINHKRYLKVDDYWGVNHKEDEFFTKVSEFLLTKYKEE